MRRQILLRMTQRQLAVAFGSWVAGVDSALQERELRDRQTKFDGVSAALGWVMLTSRDEGRNRSGSNPMPYALCPNPLTPYSTQST